MNQIIAEAGFHLAVGPDRGFVPGRRAAPAHDRGGEGGDQGGRSADEIWPDAPAKASQKDTDARWTVKHKKAKAGPDGRKPVDIAIPVFGCKTHIGIDKKHGIIRRQIVTDAAANDGKRLREGLIDHGNTAATFGGHGVPLGGEREVAEGARAGQPHPPQEAARAPDARADREGQRAQVEGPGEGRARLRPPEGRMGPAVRTVGLARAKAAVTMANIPYNMADCDGFSLKPNRRLMAWCPHEARNGPARPEQARIGRWDSGNPGQIRPHPILIDP